jgi:hypothetical protein
MVHCLNLGTQQEIKVQGKCYNNYNNNRAESTGIHGVGGSDEAVSTK